MDGKSVRRARAFRAGSCPREKASPSVGSSAARPLRPRLTAAQGPRSSSALPARRSNLNSNSQGETNAKPKRRTAPRGFAPSPQFPDTLRRGRPVYRVGGAGSNPLDTSRLWFRRIEPEHFSWFLLLTPGILPSALAGRLRRSPPLLRWRGPAKRRNSGAGRRSKQLCSLRQASKTALSLAPGVRTRRIPCDQCNVSGKACQRPRA